MGLISVENTLFRPNDRVTRAEAFAILMKSVCMDTSKSLYSTWERRVYETAKINGLTVKSWEDFHPQSSILRQDLFAIVTKINIWKKETGGCGKSLVAEKTTTNITTINTEDTTIIDTSVTQITPQSPGIFVFLRENDTEKIYTYTVKNRGMSNNIRLRYVNVFGISKINIARISLRNISGEKFSEKWQFNKGDMVYVHFEK